MIAIIKTVWLLAVGVGLMKSAPLSTAPQSDYNQTYLKLKELSEDDDLSLPSILNCTTLSNNISSPETLLFAVGNIFKDELGEVNNNEVHFNLSEFKSREKRYVHTPGDRRWASRHITYTVYSYPYPGEMSKAEVDTAIELAFDVWARHTPLSFSRIISGGDISIKFESSYHLLDNSEQCSPLDNALAHASFLIENLDFIHFNYMETWDMVKLFKVAVHEIGHTLGLDHSEDSVIMQEGPDDPDTPLTSYLKLSWDDIIGLITLYGSAWY